MANKKKPQAGNAKPAPAKKPQAGKAKPEPAKKKPQAGKAKPAPAKDKSEPVRKKKTAPAKKTKPKLSVPKAPADGRDLLRRIAIVLLAALTVSGIALSAVSLRNDRLQNKVTLLYAGMLQKANVMPITMQESDVRRNVRSTKRHGKTSAFTYYISRTLQLNADSLTGYILFGNPADNDCDLVLSVFDEADNLIYRSGGVRPGTYLTQIRPDVDGWALGAHNCKAVVTAYRGQDIAYRCIGAQYSRLTVKVGETS